MISVAIIKYTFVFSCLLILLYSFAILLYYADVMQYGQAYADLHEFKLFKWLRKKFALPLSCYICLDSSAVVATNLFDKLKKIKQRRKVIREQNTVSIRYCFLWVIFCCILNTAIFVLIDVCFCIYLSIIVTDIVFEFATFMVGCLTVLGLGLVFITPGITVQETTYAVNLYTKMIFEELQQSLKNIVVDICNDTTLQITVPDIKDKFVTHTETEGCKINVNYSTLVRKGAVTSYNQVTENIKTEDTNNTQKPTAVKNILTSQAFFITFDFEKVYVVGYQTHRHMRSLFNKFITCNRIVDHKFVYAVTQNVDAVVNEQLVGDKINTTSTGAGPEIADTTWSALKNAANGLLIIKVPVSIKNGMGLRRITGYCVINCKYSNQQSVIENVYLEIRD